MKHTDAEICQRIEDTELPEWLLREAGVQGIDELVDAMDLDTLVAYARRHKIDFDDPSQWLDDEWPAKESWLRGAVMEHMAERVEEDNHA